MGWKEEAQEEWEKVSSLEGELPQPEESGEEEEGE
jgi:hypothetical protein